MSAGKVEDEMLEWATHNTGSKRNPRFLEISLEVPLGVLADQQTRADWLDL